MLWMFFGSGENGFYFFMKDKIYLYGPFCIEFRYTEYNYT